MVLISNCMCDSQTHSFHNASSVFQISMNVSENRVIQMVNASMV